MRDERSRWRRPGWRFVGVPVFVCVLALSAGAVEIRRVSSDKARYHPPPTGSAPLITVEIVNDGPMAWSGTVELEIFDLDMSIHMASTASPAIPAGGEDTVDFTWMTPPATDHRGYLVEARLPGISQAFTAIDISSDSRRYPRYGFVTQFYITRTQMESEELIEELSRDYHLNALQFYDWMWRHENVIERTGGMPSASWRDWRNRDISLMNLRAMTAKASNLNVAAMAYFQIYAGRAGYETMSSVSPLWGLYCTDTAPTMTDQVYFQPILADPIRLFLFNPADPNWQVHLLAEYEEAIDEVGFHGIHLDQLGDIDVHPDPTKTQVNCRPARSYDHSGDPVDLANGFVSMVNASRTKLDSLAVGPPGPKYLTFNMVGGAVDGFAIPETTRYAEVDFLYGEIWDSPSYKNLHDFIRRAREESDGKALVVAAYMNPKAGDETASVATCGGGGCFDLPSVLLTDATIFASGATHLELGDDAEMLERPCFRTQGFIETQELKDALRDYYNFITAYEYLLFDPALRYADGGGQWIDIEQGGTTLATSGVAATQKIWHITRRSATAEIVHLINLSDQTRVGWREVATVEPVPIPLLDVTYRIGPDAVVNDVYFASPDVDPMLSPRTVPHMKMTRIPSIVADDARGRFVRFPLPRLAYWNMIYIDRLLDVPADPARYEAEVALKSSVSESMSHVGFSGSGYVEGFDDPDDSVSFLALFPGEHRGYALDLGYSIVASTSGAVAPATVKILIDGQRVGGLELEPLGDTEGWNTKSIHVYLPPGPHDVVVLPGAGNATRVRLDYMEVCTETNGLRAEYYKTPDLTRRGVGRTDARIVWDWDMVGPDPCLLDSSVRVNDFSARWTGFVMPRFSETYTFRTETDEGVRLWLDGELVIDDWTPPLNLTNTAMRSVTAGQKYPIRLEYYDETGPAHASLYWESSTQSRQIIPESRLFPALGPAVVPGGVPFRRGDVNLDAQFDLSDAIWILEWLFIGSRTLDCEAAADVNDDELVDVSDAMSILLYMFRDTRPPPRCPFFRCGLDPTAGSFTCAKSPCTE